MLRFMAHRLVFMLVTLWIVITVVFFLLRLAPGGPFDAERALHPVVEQNLRAKYNLDTPLLSQYFSYLFDLIQGDFGPSYRNKDFSVSELIASGLPISLKIGGLALGFALICGVAVGLLAATYRDTAIDTTILTVSSTTLALPPLISGPLLVLVFALVLRWFPAGGIDTPYHYVLPALSLSVPYIGAIARLMRSSTIEVLNKPFVLTAHSKGLSNLRTLARHVFPLSSVPVISYFGPASATLLAGSMIVEQVFAIPGLGRFFVGGALAQDYTLVLGAVVVYCALILLLNLLVDLAYVLIHPQAKLHEE